MDNQRLLIWAAFGFTAWLTYQAWLNDYGPQQQPVAAPTTTEATQPDAIGDNLGGGLPEFSAEGNDAPAALPSSDVGTERQQTTAAPGISVTTDVLQLEISTQGGALRRASLLGYPIHKDRPDQLIELLSPQQNNFGMIRMGLRSDDAARPGPDHLATFTSPQSSYSLGSAEELVVPLSWTGADGGVVEKRFVFTPGSYIIRVEQEVTNDSDQPWRLDQYGQLLRHSAEPKRSMFDVDSYSFAGPIVYDGDKSEKLKRDDLLEDGAYQNTAENGWVGAIEHHFLSAIVPEQEAPNIFQVAVTGHVTTASVIGAKQRRIYGVGFGRRCHWLHS